MSSPSVSSSPSTPTGNGAMTNGALNGSSTSGSNGSNGSNGSSGGGRPSDRRRKVLHEELSVPIVSNFIPVTTYYTAADKVYQSFQSLYGQIRASRRPGTKESHDMLDDAFVYGKRYCLFCMDAIPKHNYSSAARFRPLQARHTQQCARVVGQLEQIVDAMDEEEVVLERMRQEQERLRKIEQERQEREEQKALEQRLQLLKPSAGKKQADQGTKGASATSLEDSALSKLQQLQQQMNGVKPAAAEAEAAVSPSKLDPSGEKVVGTSRYRILDDSSDEEDDEAEGNEGRIPPPMLPPPPSYEQIQSHTREFLGPGSTPQNKRGSGAAVLPPSAPLADQDRRNRTQPREPSQKAAKRVPMRQLKIQCQNEYFALQQNGKINVRSLSTYQGRVDASTNGCTVISALVAARHLNAPATQEMIDDTQIAHVIDRECGPILRQIRSKLGLGGHALIIPSDVHDHLVDMKILQQKYFEGAAGGNILDEHHVGQFFKLLAIGDDAKGMYRKAAATLFFREHVISIVKRPNSQQFDWIDSLPGSSSNSGIRGSRTVCRDLKALQTQLRWYATRKFSDQHCNYVDRNKWDDNLADFDPRVFQGFVWSVK